MKLPYKTDVSVLLLFFNRADHFSMVWAEVKKARPSRLFLYQDGPREGKDDMPGILACRELVKDEEIDWECEVHRNYQDKNYGCDPSGFMSHRWAFSLTDKCIVLEDDVVPSQSFFPFCKELLDRYESDERITMIAGFMVDESRGNELQNNTRSVAGAENDDSYFFTRVFSIWGWASWSRVVNNWDSDYNFVKDPSTFKRLKEKVAKYNQRADMPQMCVDHSLSGKQYFESIFWAYMLLHDGLAIMPKCNLINNVGLDGGTHYSAQLELLPKRLRRQFVMPRMEIGFPLVHPRSVEEDKSYQNVFYLMNAWNNPCRKIQYSMEELWLNLRHGNVKKIYSSALNRLFKTLGMRKHS